MRINDKNSGFTLMELVIVVTVSTVLVSSIILMVNPKESLARGRDNKRLADISYMERAVNEFKLDNSICPGVPDHLYTSTTTPFGSTDLTSANSGWLGLDLSRYISHYPIDPKNDLTYYYSYKTSGTEYEFNTKLEHLVDKMQNDGGNDLLFFESGDDLTLIEPL